MNPSEIIDQWWTEKVRGSVIAQHTDAWNYMLDVVENLKARFAAETPDAAAALRAKDFDLKVEE